MPDPAVPNSSVDGGPDRWSTAEALELWKYFDGVGATDKNTMVTTSSWLLGFSALIVGYIVTNLVGENQGRGISQPLRALCLASLGFVVSCVAAYVSLLYGGYANRNWEKADSIARKRAAHGPKWSDLLTRGTIPDGTVIEASWLYLLAARWSKPCDHSKDLAPVFRIFAKLAAFAALVDLGIGAWAAICLIFSH